MKVQIIREIEQDELLQQELNDDLDLDRVNIEDEDYDED